MGMNYEFERHIKSEREAGNYKGIELLRAQQTMFNSLVDAGLITELPRESSIGNSQSFEEFFDSIPFVEEFGAQLRLYRLSLGMSALGLSKRAKIDQSYLSKIEKGRRRAPTSEKVISMIKILNLPERQAEHLVKLAGYNPSILR